jgi:hypothetical protein
MERAEGRVSPTGVLARRLGGLVAAVLSLSLAACDFGGLVVRLHDFESRQVLGLTLWRSPVGANAFQRDLDLDFFEPEVDASGNEVVPCRFEGASGVQELEANLFRNPEDPDEIILILWGLPFAPGSEYRVSAFNAAGDSPLSAASYVPPVS